MTRVGGFPGQAAARRWVRTCVRTRAHRPPSWGPGDRSLYATGAYGLIEGISAGGRRGRTGGTRDSPMSWSGCSAGPGTVPGYLIKIARPMVCTAGCPTAIPDPLLPALFYSFNLPLRFYWSDNRICRGRPPITNIQPYPKFSPGVLRRPSASFIASASMGRTLKTTTVLPPDTSHTGAP